MTLFIIILSLLFQPSASALSLSPGYIAITDLLQSGESYEVTRFTLTSEEAWKSDVVFLPIGAVSGQVLSFELESAVLPAGGTTTALARLSLPGGMPGGKWQAGFLALTIPRQFPANLALRGTIEFQVEVPLGITRIEALAMLTEKLKIKSSENRPFPDIEASDVRSQLLAGAFEQGLVKGYPDGTFQPSELLSRAEAAVILQRVLKVEESRIEATDVPSDHWAFSAVSAILTVGSLQTSPGGEFGPEQPVGRHIWEKLVGIVAADTSKEITASSGLPSLFHLPLSLQFNILQ